MIGTEVARLYTFLRQQGAVYCSLEYRHAPPEGGPSTLLLYLFSPSEVRSAAVIATCRFDGVRNLRLSAPGPLQLADLRIEDVKDRGWEDVGFEVREIENGALSFLCKGFEFAPVAGDPTA